MKITCEGAKCYVTEVETMASGAINYFTAHFVFDSAWADFIAANKLYGVFEGSNNTIFTSLIYNSETLEYDCDVPWETITQPGELLVGAIGYINDTEDIILTTNMAFGYRVPQGAATNATQGAQASGLLLEMLVLAEEVQENADLTIENADLTIENADRAELALSRWPYIDEVTNNWFRWDAATEIYVDTGVRATGPAAGFGTPTISATQGAEGTQPQATITASGPDTAKIFNFDLIIPKGDTGTAAEIIINSTATGEPGTDASVTNIGDSHTAILDFTIPQGLKGDTGRGLTILGYYDTLSDLQTAHPTATAGDAYGVGTTAPYDVYIWDGVNNIWKNNGTISGTYTQIVRW